MKFTIPGEPHPKARHRSFLKGGKICSFDPQHKEVGDVRRLLEWRLWTAKSHDEREISLNAVNLASGDRYRVDLTFYIPIPISLNRSQRNAVLWGFEIPTQCDVDNLVKFYMDAANGVLYPDDRLVTKVTGEKVYSKNPRTEMIIMCEKKEEIDPDAMKIMDIYGADDFYLLLADMNEFFALYDMQQKEKWLVDSIGEDFSEARHMRSAYLLSRMAEHHAKLLKKINDTAPEYWKRCDETKPIKMYDKALC